MMRLTDEYFYPSFKNLFLSCLLSHSFPLLLRRGREEVEYLNPVRLIRSPRMINGWISSCLSDRDESLSTPLVSRNSISIIEVEKEE
jgi:hypothetical protein